MSKILIVFTGGTFSMRIDKQAGGAVPHFSGQESLEAIPELLSIAPIDIYDFGMYPGPHMTPDLMFQLAKEIEAYAQSGKYLGIVVVHGTDTLEETAYLLDLTVDTSIPIVVTGSMRSRDENNWDGPRNLIDSAQLCVNPNCQDIGVLVCLGGEVNAASEVTKTHTEAEETFHSLDFGALGFIQRGRVILNRLPRKREVLHSPTINTNVDLIKVYAGMDEKFFRFSADSGISGLVVEAMGVGNVPPPAFEGIKYVREKGIPVLLVSRCPMGETLDIYSYPGAGKHLHNLGVIFTDFLNGQKARIKLMLALGNTTDERELKKLFGD